MSSSHWYYSSYTCMVCTINSAGQARTRHDTSLGYLHLLAKDTNIHTETKKKKKKRKEENGHVIAQTKTCSQGLGLGWQHWDILHNDQTIRLQILQAQTCQFRISEQSQKRLIVLYILQRNPCTPPAKRKCFFTNTYAQQTFIQTLCHRRLKTLLPKQEVQIT